MKTDLEPLTAKLRSLHKELSSLSQATANDRRPIELDQQAVGRLSRMDSLQVQAMAQAQSARRDVQLRRIEAALGRLEVGEYGYCVSCGEAINVRRLDLDPATPHCAKCAQ